MAKEIDFPTDTEFAEWQTKLAETYCSVLKEKAARTDLIGNKFLAKKIENAERDAAAKRRRYESLTAQQQNEGEGS